MDGGQVGLGRAPEVHVVLLGAAVVDLVLVGEPVHTGQVGSGAAHGVARPVD